MTETTLTPISNFLTYFPEFDRGRPIAGGQVYIGEPDFDPEVVANQKDVTLIQENGDTVAASQPVILSAGGVPTYNGSPARMQFTGNYSLKVLSSQGAQIYYIPNYEVVNQGINSLVPSSAAVPAGTTVITVPTYVPNVNTSVYFLNSNVAVVGVDIEETDSTTLTLTSPVPEDSTLYIYRFNSGTINTAAASNVSHAALSQSVEVSLNGSAGLQRDPSFPFIQTNRKTAEVFSALETLDDATQRDEVRNYTSTDNVNDALQEAINYASNNGLHTVLVPSGLWNFNELFLHYDATDNAGFNSLARYQGRIHLVGQGRGHYPNLTNSDYVGTVLKSAYAAVTAGIVCDGSNVSAYQGQDVRISNMAIEVDNATLAIKLAQCPQNSGTDNLVVRQKGAGGGIEHDDLWNCWHSNLFINGAGKATSLGKGFFVHNSSQAAGFANLSNITSNAFAEPIYLGHDDRATAARLHGINGMNIQGGEGVTGVTLGGGLASANLGIHAEDNELGMRIIDGARNIDVRLTTATNDKDLEVGSSVSSENHYENITVRPEFISGDAAEICEVFTSGNTSNLTFYKPKFTGDGTNLAFKLANAVHHNLSIIDPVYNSILTEIDNPIRVQLLVEEQKEVRRTGNTGGALSAAPFEFSQDSTTGAQPTAKIQQRDLSEAFVRFSSDAITPTTNTNHINTKNGAGSVDGPLNGSGGYTYYGVVEVEIETSAGVVTKWLPLYDAV